jgi:peptidoglycan/LPS O-acetylase OafA/YrhL
MSSSPRDPRLDGWRGLAITLVLVGHFIPGLGFAAQAGVEFFFALSGVLMADLLVRDRQPIGIFLWRRAVRIYPALLVYVVAITAVLAAASLLHDDVFKWRSPAAALLLVHNYLPLGDATPLFEHSWSLAVEEHSYLLLLLLVWLGRRHGIGPALLAASLAVLLIMRGALLSDAQGNNVQSLFWRSDVRAASILLPFAVRIAMRHGDARWLEWVSPFFGVFAISTLVGYATLPPHSWIAVASGSVCATGAVNLLGANRVAGPAIIEAPLLRVIAAYSFSLYLWQQFFYVLTHNGLPAALAVPPLIACAVLSYRLVERPSRLWGQKVFPRTGAAASRGPIEVDHNEREPALFRTGSPLPHKEGRVRR